MRTLEHFYINTLSKGKREVTPRGSMQGMEVHLNSTCQLLLLQYDKKEGTINATVDKTRFFFESFSYYPILSFDVEHATSGSHIKLTQQTC